MMKLGVVVVLALLFLHGSVADDGSGDTTVSTVTEPTEGSGYETTSEVVPSKEPTGQTEIPCSAGLLCPESQDCPEGFIKSFDSICAEACDANYNWCPLGGDCKDHNKTYECSCAAGYYRANEGDTQCVAGKFFGGRLKLIGKYDAEMNMNDTLKEEINNNLVRKLFDDGSNGFVSSRVLELSDGSIIVTYELVYGANANEDVVKDAFYTSTDGCKNDNYTAGGDKYVINCTATNETLIMDDVLCDYTSGSCDSESTNCRSTEGNFWCDCKQGYGKSVEGATSCLEIVCTEDNECNSPFGWCKNTYANEVDNYCDCMWGFSGTTCKDPWEFVFTVVTAGLGLILIIVLAVLIHARSRTKPSKKTESLEELNLTNPFVDFQPGIVRAKAPSGLYNISDSLDNKDANGYSAAKCNSYSNGAYSHAYDSIQPTRKGDYESSNLTAPGKSDGAEYF